MCQFGIKGLSFALVAMLGMCLTSDEAAAQGYAVVGYQPIVAPIQPVVFAPVYLAPPPVVISPVPVVAVPTIVHSGYHAPSPIPVGGIYKQRINPGLFGQMNYRTKGIDPCIGPYKQHTRVGWAGCRYHGRTW
jgi:hypothetical protein